MFPRLEVVCLGQTQFAELVKLNLENLKAEAEAEAEAEADICSAWIQRKQTL